MTFKRAPATRHSFYDCALRTAHQSPATTVGFEIKRSALTSLYVIAKMAPQTVCYCSTCFYLTSQVGVLR